MYMCGSIWGIWILYITPLFNFMWNLNKKFWEELITYFPFAIIWVFGMRSRKKTLVCMWNEVNKTIQFERLQCWCYWWKGFMKYAIKMASCGILYIPSSLKIGTGVQAILRLCLRNLRGCNVDITNGRDFLVMPLRWAQVLWYTYKVS
jgi:hypothetical protein